MFSHKCYVSQQLAMMLGSDAITRDTVSNHSPTISESKNIDNAYLLYFIKDENIYRRGHFTVTRSHLIIDLTVGIRFSSIKLVEFVYDKPESHMFEIVFNDDLTIYIAYGHSSSPITNEIRLLTDQFRYHVNSQWQSIRGIDNKKYVTLKMNWTMK
ncbi:unnamed protein product [Rotaria magnacalcarata]|uniref:Uncharacterized protein n=2 Tax=Rotaria magnacalcarata TaxID=392030 RepID=A0A819R8T5_9BILA|nr:unnamed protein product [Rotaria magnacalcarata]